jgi:cytochrome P450
LTRQCPVTRFGPEFLEDRHSAYEHLRAADPVCPAVLPSGERVWLVTRHADVREGMSDPRLSNDSTRWQQGVRPYAAAPDLEAAIAQDMLNADPPRHTGMREVIAEWLTVARSERFRDHLADICAELLDGFTVGTVIDVVRDYTEPFASRAAADLLGVSHEFHAEFCRLAHQIVVAMLNKHTDSDLVAPSTRLLDMAKEMIESKRGAPAEDLLTTLVAAHDAGRLSAADLTSTMHLLLIAGHEGPTNLSGSGIQLLLTNPDQLDRLRADPGLLPSAVEEFLRMEPPLDLAFPRYAEVPITLSEVTIPAGEPIMFSLVSAGRDEDRFRDPDRLDIGRRERHHFAFGRGRHYCVGAALGRIECQVAIGSLLSRFPDLRLAPGENVAWRPSVIARGPARMLVQL